MADTDQPTSKGSNIDQIIASGAKTNANFDFSGILDSYFKGRDQRYKQDVRDAFKDDSGNFRADLRDDQGNPDGTKMYERLMAIGGAPVADNAAKIADTGFTMTRYRNAPTVQAVIDGEQTQQPGPVFPPSANRNAPARVAPPLARGGLASSAAPGAPQGDQPGSIVSMVSGAGIPDEKAGIIIGNLAKMVGIDPNATVPTEKQARIQGALQSFLGRNPGSANATPMSQPPPQGMPPGGGNGIVQANAPGVQGPNAVMAGGPPPPVQSAPLPQAPIPPRGPALPQPASQAPTDPTLGGLIPPGYPDAGAYVRRLEKIATTIPMLPEQLKGLTEKIQAIRKALEPTPDMKNARAAGMSMKDFLDRGDTATADRAVLTTSILPKLDKSQDAAAAARDEIQAIHRSREQMDAPGGIFSGSAAEVRKNVAKVAELLGVANVDKVANTEAFGSAIGSRVLSLVKNLGSGTAISNADRDFAAAMAGGNIRLDEKSIRKILDIGEKAARVRIDQHNGLADRTLKSSDALKDYGSVYHVDQPEQYQRAGTMPAPKPGAVIGGHRFLGGNPNSRQSWGAL